MSIFLFIYIKLLNYTRFYFTRSILSLIMATATGFKVKQGNDEKDLADILPVFPEGTNTNVVGLTTGSTPLKITCRDSREGQWVSTKTLADYLGEYYHVPNEAQYVLYDPATRPTFKLRYKACGQYGSVTADSKTLNGKSRWVYIYKNSGKIYIHSKYEDSSDAKTTTFSASDFPNKVLPKVLLCVFCAAGGQGTASSNTIGHGGGGGGGGAAYVFVKVPEADGNTSKNFIFFNLPGGCGYGCSNSYLGSYGGNAYFQLHDNNGTMRMQFQAVGGMGGLGIVPAEPRPVSEKSGYVYGEGGGIIPATEAEYKNLYGYGTLW